MAKLQLAVTQAIRIDLPIDVRRAQNQQRKVKDKTRKRGLQVSASHAPEGELINTPVATPPTPAAPKVAPSLETPKQPSGLALRLFPNGL